MLDWEVKGHVTATCDDKIVYCRIIGFANMNNCIPFEHFSTRMQEQGYREFVLDFSSCEGIDSTFLGILLGMSVGSDSRPQVTVVNVVPGVRRILAEVGIDRLLDVCPDHVALPEIPMQRIPSVEWGEEERLQMILRAHENLCRVHSDNEALFGQFIKLLRQELAAKHAETSTQIVKTDPGGEGPPGDP